MHASKAWIAYDIIRKNFYVTSLLNFKVYLHKGRIYIIHKTDFAMN